MRAIPHRCGTRRNFLRTVAGGAVTAILAACGTTRAPTATPAPDRAPSAVSATVTPNAATPKGTLTLAVASFPNSIDIFKEQSLVRFGMGEMLTRITPDNKVEPWLARSVANVDPLTWRVVLRPNAKFWDGTPVDADAVIAAIKRNWSGYPDGKGLLSDATEMIARDATTLDFKTPEPNGIFPNIISSPYFIIHKPTTPGGNDGTILTGPYRHTSFLVDNMMVAEPFLDHWAGPPPIARFTVRNAPDPNSAALALQAGDVDMLFGLPPETLRGFDETITSYTPPSGRIHLANLNVNRLPFSDRAVREAAALGVDRSAFVTIALDGKGAPATAMFPPGLGFDTIPLQGTDPARAKQLLDDAGWIVGPDGVRAKDGKRLSFILYSTPGRREITPIAVAMQSQLKPLGFDIQVKEVQNTRDVTKNGDWDAVINSNNMSSTADPLYEINRLLLKGGGDNPANYTNPQIEGIAVQMRPELDPAKRQALSVQVQQIVKAEVPNIFLVVTPLVTSFKKGKVQGFVPRADDTYLFDDTLSVT